MFVLPGLEGCAAGMAPLCRRLKIKICVLQYGFEEKSNTLDDLVNRLHKVIRALLYLKKLETKFLYSQVKFLLVTFYLELKCEILFQTIKSRLSPGSPYVLLGYSFGTLPMLKLAEILESEGLCILNCLNESQ